MVAAPVPAVAPAVFAAGGDRQRRPAEGDDVVVVFVRGRDLDQVHLALAPVAQLFDPQARSLLVRGFGILEVFVLALALHQPEAARVAVLETAVLQRRRDLPLARSDEQTSALQSLMRHSYAVYC